MIAYVRTQSGAVVRGARRPSGIVDIGDACTDCGCSTSPGSGAWVNRIPSEWQREAGSPVISGYLCAECQAVECDRCGELTIEYSAAPAGFGFWCDDCRECSECGGTGAIPAANPEQDQDNGYAPCPECSPEVES